ncbi:type I restriction-modification system subunit M [Ruminococcus flavefaciens]|uniref:site-specific DNA-methyltransferase (adenine-specific) n=1 Tax=Ruminococcus flavefaciens TaxID=1265 RepID=A0A1K1MH57_RUMFL|nr:type I restriction-modification system subunit M [Ruminococcus flavefaciens]SFW22458.1 type I restriction enzyme M protein [Ruminococcus flavefaciens]
MTKQELANKIWETANELRKNIKASEYKDYILGFMFYKYLSDKEIEYLHELGGESPEELKTLEETTIDMFKDHNGYFIQYDDLFPVWQEKGLALGAKDVSEAIERFYDSIEAKGIGNRNPYQKLFDQIFEALHSKLSKLGDNAGSRDQSVRNIVDLIWQIPPKNKDYDVLGYIYEYLIKKFSSEAKKDGAFYTPHGLTSLMARIVADRLKNKNEVSVYDPTIGTAGLLLNIGKEMGRYVDEDKIVYYGQEYITETCRLAKMNLFMQDIRIQNIRVREGDSLDKDWPYFDDDTAYEALPVDAVVSNPPYSQRWDPDSHKLDERFKYGLAPRKQADLAFLLHCLYHVKDKEGIMAIVLPHGVLFRGGTEKAIRTQLVDNHCIETIIGFPGNMFFATDIPVIVMILSKGRKESDILFVDASASYGKEATQHVLREMDIQRIFDVVINRKKEDNFSELVTLQQIKENDYNLNMPRYVSASEKRNPVDPYSVMTGKISNIDLEKFKGYWKLFPNLKSYVFSEEDGYNTFKAASIKETVFADKDVTRYIADIGVISSQFRGLLCDSLLSDSVDRKDFDKIKNELFRLYGNIELLDKYSVYQAFVDEWGIIDEDLIRIKNEGKGICKETEPNMVLVKNNSTKKYDEVQKGIKGKIISILMIQQVYYAEELEKLSKLNSRSAALENEIEELWGELDDDIKSSLVKDSNNDGNDEEKKMDIKKISDEVKRLLADFNSPEINTLNEYLDIKKKEDKIAFINIHSEINWNSMKQNKDTTYGSSEVKKRIEAIKLEHDYDTDTDEGKIINIKKDAEEKTRVNSKAKKLSAELESKAVEKMSNLTDEEVNSLLTKKWIEPVMQSIDNDVEQVVMKLVNELQALRDKFEHSMPEIDNEISELEKSLYYMLEDLSGSNRDMEAVTMFRKELFTDEESS